MKKVLSVLLVLGLGILLVSGCQTSSAPPTKALDNSTAGTYSLLGIQVIDNFNQSISKWVSSGAVNTGVVGSGVRGASLVTQSITSEGNGYSHILETTVEGMAVITVDAHVKLDKNSSGEVTDAYVYGSYIATLSNVTYTVTLGKDYGTVTADPYHAVATWSNHQVTSITGSGPLTETIAATSGTTSHDVVLTFDLSGFVIPIPSITPADTYPDGHITIDITFDGEPQADNIVLNFSGNETVNLVYGSYSTTFTIGPIHIP